MNVILLDPILEQGFEAFSQGDSDTAISLIQPIAEEGDADAQWVLGYVCYRKDDFDRAEYYYYLSAIQGNPKGQFLLGELYHWWELGNERHDIYTAF